MNFELTIKDVFSQAWKFTKEHLWFLVSYLIIFFLINAFLSFLENRVFHNGFIAAVIYLLGAFISFFIQMGFINSSLMITDGLKPGYDQLYANGHHILSWIVAHFLFILMISVGLVFLIFPGLYLLARFSLYPFFILDKNMGPIESLGAASRASRGKCWFLFLLFLCTLLLNLLGCLFFGIGLLITMPISALAWALVYRKLTRSEPEIIAPK